MYIMAGFSFFTHFLPLCFATLFPATESNIIKVVTQSPSVAGVFLLTDAGRYTLNFTAARAACPFLNVTMATRGQMERAVQQGLETCKYGWIAEQIAAIPRLTSDSRCGKGKTGVVLWSAGVDKEFGVFCFNASDLEETQKTSTASSQTSRSPSTPTALTRTPAPTTAMMKSTTRAAPSRTTGSPEQTFFTSALALLAETTHPPRISSAPASLQPLSTCTPTSPPHLITSKPTVVASAFTASVSVLPQSVSSAKPSLGAVPTALITLGVVLLLLTAAGAVWCYKLNVFTLCSLGHQKDDTETEMWRHTDSEMDLHSQHEAGEDDELGKSDRKYSGDITLCMNADIKTNCSE